ncbi:MAG: CsoS2 family carboxysome shell protein [Acidiferrobacter thiooxydans]
MSDLSSSGPLHGRALAQEMRRRQAEQKTRGQGKAAVRAQQAKPEVNRRVAPATAVEPVALEAQAAKPRGREVARARRAARCAGAPCWSDPKERAASVAPASMPAAEDPKPEKPKETEVVAPSEEAALMDSICEVAEGNPEALGWRETGVRALCKARRRSVAQRGKVAIPVRNGLISAAARQHYLETGNAREFARLHRRELATHGRGAAQPARPSGRRRKPEAPPKVEVGTTLSGSPVTGTQVDRTRAITGIEPGSCRTITGTEYLGSEHYAGFCEARPAPRPAKVRVGRTGRDLDVTGTHMGRVGSVTGDEAGTCRPVTGTEYVGSDDFQAVCKIEAPTRAPKVAVGRTARRELPVSGSDEARANRVTGAEVGESAKITGSQYADGGAARMTINGAPKKVALTHTISGRPVSGTAVDQTTKITGLDAGTCRTLTGTEYLSHESFTSVCGTRPEPTEPPKVEESYTEKRQRITGNLVDRSEKVTGNEPGSCQRLTGTGYNGPQLCGGGADKVQRMTGVGGGTVTGTGMDRLPKTTGDERGGCWPVTGTVYHGREHYAPCASTPQAGARKVGLTRTDKGHLVSGPLLGADEAVTGNEAGVHLPVTGTPYAGREESAMSGYEAAAMTGKAENGTQSAGCGGGCGCKRRFEELENRVRELQAEVGSTAGGGVMPSGRFVAATFPEARAVQEPPAVGGFSVAAPAQEGRSRITGNAADHGARITGPINLARGLVTGTPEFRARDTMALSAQAAPKLVASEAGEESTPPAAGAWRITGDDWSRGGRVTGTEGHWAQGRNPTQRGTARTCVMSAAGNRERPLAVPVPEGKVTGSSGNTGKGSLVTYSGGARG